MWEAWLLMGLRWSVQKELCLKKADSEDIIRSLWTDSEKRELQLE